MKSIRHLLLCAALLAPLCGRAADVTISVYNDEPTQRQELVELDAADVMRRAGVADGSRLVVRNAFGQQVAYQLTHDGKLLVDVAVRPCGKTVLTASEGVPEPMRTWVQGKMYPLRKDDIGWENDRGMYRVYGPALQKTGEKSFGIDVWTKNSKELTMSERYYADYEGNVTGWANAENGRKNRDIDLHTTFHLDHGDGLDCYAVGPSLGCGAPALMVDGRLVLPYCYQSYRILDNGPLRFTLELTFAPTRVGGDEHVVEHRIISLDKGANFNRMTVWYDGLMQPRDLAAGVVIHSADKESVVVGRNFVQYADPTDEPARHGFQLYVAAVFPNGADTRVLPAEPPSGGIEGHAVGIRRALKAGERYTYFFGSAWSAYDVRSQEEWQVRVDHFLRAQERPLVVDVE